MPDETADPRLRLPAKSVLLNGREANGVSPGDRGFLYGEGVFETVAVRNGRPLHFDLHLARLVRGCERLDLGLPDVAVAVEEAHRICSGHGQAVLKLVVTGGEGERGYAPPARRVANRYVMIRPWPEYLRRFDPAGWSARLCETRLAVNPRLAGIKHLNRLEQVLARAELGPDDDEGIVLDAAGNVVEGTSSNLLLVSGGALVTPDLSRCGVEGIMRGRVLDAASGLSIPTEVRKVSLDELHDAQALFFTNVIIGIRSVGRLGGHRFARHPWFDGLCREIRRVESVGA